MNTKVFGTMLVVLVLVTASGCSPLGSVNSPSLPPLNCVVALPAQCDSDKQTVVGNVILRDVPCKSTVEVLIAGKRRAELSIPDGVAYENNPEGRQTALDEPMAEIGRAMREIPPSGIESNSPCALRVFDYLKQKHEPMRVLVMGVPADRDGPIAGAQLQSEAYLLAPQHPWGVSANCERDLAGVSVYWAINVDELAGGLAQKDALMRFVGLFLKMRGARLAAFGDPQLVAKQFVAQQQADLSAGFELDRGQTTLAMRDFTPAKRDDFIPPPGAPKPQPAPVPEELKRLREESGSLTAENDATQKKIESLERDIADKTGAAAARQTECDDLKGQSARAASTVEAGRRKLALAKDSLAELQERLSESERANSKLQAILSANQSLKDALARSRAEAEAAQKHLESLMRLIAN